jgi:hypothetical protein
LVTSTSILLPASAIELNRDITGGEAMVLTATTEGYAFLIDSLRINESINRDINLTWEAAFTDSTVNFTSSGFMGGKNLVLNYSGGFTSGVPSVENLTWSGNWSGFLGNDSIDATDSASFLLGSDGSYTGLQFTQNSSISNLITTGVTTSDTKTTIVTGVEALFSLAGRFLGFLYGGKLGEEAGGVIADELGGAISKIILDPPKDPPVKGDEDGIFSRTGGGKLNYRKNQTLEGGFYDTSVLMGSGTCNLEGCNFIGNAQAVPEPLTTFGVLTAVGFGIIFKRKLQ